MAICRYWAEESVPISMNFIHNGFKLKGTEAVGFISINPLLNISYYLSLGISLISTIIVSNFKKNKVKNINKLKI